MPSFVAVAGTATTERVPGAGVAGTAAIDPSTLSGIVSGTATTDYGAIAPWLAVTRWTMVSVYVAGERIRGIQGVVTIDESTGTLVRTASFTVVDPRACFADPESVIRGALPVWIVLTCGEGANVSSWTAFVGTIESVTNDGPYCPRASVKSVSAAADLWTGSTAGCVRAAPFAGLTRAQILSYYAASVGRTLVLPMPGAVVRQPVDLSGITVEALLLRYAEVEGWYVREGDGGSLEVLTEDDLLSAPPLWSLSPSAYHADREDLPNRPTTILTVGGSQIGLGVSAPEVPIDTTSESSGTYADGRHWLKRTTVTTWYGQEVKAFTIEWCDYAVKGVTDEPSRFVFFAEESVVTTYVTVTVNGATVPTAQVLSVTRKTIGWYSPLDSIGAGYEWADGTHHVDAKEKWCLTGETTTVQTWGAPTDPLPCRLLSIRETTYGWYSPQVFPAVDGSLAISQAGTPGTSTWAYRAYWFNAQGQLLAISPVNGTDTGPDVVTADDHNIVTPTAPAGATWMYLERMEAPSAYVLGIFQTALIVPVDDLGGLQVGGQLAHQFDDGTFRDGPYTWRETASKETRYRDNLAEVEAGTTNVRRATTDVATSGWALAGTGATTDVRGFPFESYREIQMESTVRSGLAWQGSHAVATSIRSVDGSSSSSRSVEPAAVPEPFVVSGVVPSYTQSPVAYTLSAWTDVYPALARTETSADIESLAEAERVCRRRLRSELGVRLTLSAPMIPSLRCWDVVAVSDAARQLVLARGWVERLTRTADTANGKFGMSLTVVLFPEGV